MSNHEIKTNAYYVPSFYSDAGNFIGEPLSKDKADVKADYDMLSAAYKKLADALSGTHIKTDLAIGRPFSDFGSSVKSMIAEDYKGETEASLQVNLDNDRFVLPVTHDNIMKLAEAYQAGANAVNHLKSDQASSNEAALFTAATTAMKTNLKGFAR